MSCELLFFAFVDSWNYRRFTCGNSSHLQGERYTVKSRKLPQTSCGNFSWRGTSLFAVEFEFREDDDIDPLQRRFVEAANDATFLIQHMRAVKPNDVYNEMQHAMGEMVAKDSTPERFVVTLRKAAD